MGAIEVPKNETIHSFVSTHNPTTGQSQNADSAPTFVVRNESGTSISSGTTTFVTTGEYRFSFATTSASFVIGQFCQVIVTGTVAGVTQKAVVMTFRIQETEVVVGVPKVDVYAIDNNVNAPENAVDFFNQGYDNITNTVNSNLEHVGGTPLTSTAEVNLRAFWNNAGNATAKIADNIGGGAVDWTTAEKNQIRWRLGFDGTTAVPSTNIPHLGIVDSNLVQVNANATVAVNFQDFVTFGYDPVNNRVFADTRAIDNSTLAAGNLNDMVTQAYDATNNRIQSDMRAVNGFTGTVQLFADMMAQAYNSSQNVLNVNVKQYNEVPLTSEGADNIVSFFGNLTNLTAKIVDDVGGSGGGGTTDWTADERADIRYRLGVDGATAVPTNQPNLGVISANVVLLNGNGTASLYLEDLVTSGYDNVNNRVYADTRSVVGQVVASNTATNWNTFYFNAGLPTGKVVDSINNVTEIQGSSGTVSNLADLLNQAYDSVNNRINSNVVSVASENLSQRAGDNFQLFFDNTGLLTSKIVNNVGGVGGDATIANQNSILTGLSDIKGAGWSAPSNLVNIPGNVWNYGTKTLTSPVNITSDGLTIDNVYHSDIMVNKDGANDEYTATWFKNGEIVSGTLLVNPTISAWNRDTGSSLFSLQSMSLVASDAVKFTTSSQIPANVTAIVEVRATIGGSLRKWRKLLPRE